VQGTVDEDTMTTWMQRLCLAACVGWGAPSLASEAPVDLAGFTDVVPAKVHVSSRLRGRLRGGHMATLTGWAFLGSGTIMGVGGGMMGLYDFNGPWYEKAAYDRVFNVRSKSSVPMIVIGSALGGAGVPLVITGVLLEMEGLKKLGLMRNTLGWAGFSVMMGGVAVVSLAALLGPGGLVAGAAVGGVGFILLAVQYGLNEMAARRIPEARRRALYGPRGKTKKVRVTVAPVLRPKGGGLSVVGMF
jgi:hypothetical protein